MISTTLIFDEWTTRALILHVGFAPYSTLATGH